MSTDPKVKLHRRSAALDGRVFTVLTPPPSMSVRFATNFFHETWHVLTDTAGAQLLGRICWWLSYQRRPNSIVVIHDPFLVPNPFDGDKSTPIALCNSDLAHVSPRAASDLKRWLDRPGRSEGSVRVATPSLTCYLELGPDWAPWPGPPPSGAMSQLRSDQQDRGSWWRLRDWQTLTTRVNGFVLISAQAELLRMWAISASQLGSAWYEGTESTFLDHPLRRDRSGEIQVFERFPEMVQTAIEVRERLFPGSSSRQLLDDERRVVWAALPPGHQEGPSA